nr:MAG TPA: hypothetical protein [Caudoviricetes sp.]
MPLAGRGRAHTRKLDRPTDDDPGPIGACPRPGRPGRGCARASSLRCMPRCLPTATAPIASLRSATRAPGRS